MKNYIQKLKDVLNGTLTIEASLKYTLMCYFLAMIHLIITIVFYRFSVFPMYFYNAFVTVLYLYIGSVLIKKNSYTSIFYICFLEILLHSIMATLLLGWNWGFMIYTIALVPVGFYLSFATDQFRRRMHRPIIFGILICLCYVLTKTFSFYHEPLYEEFASPAFISYYYCFNSILAFFMLMIYSILFVIEIEHMHKNMELEKETLDAIANHDPLTHLLNRRSMEIHLEHVMEIAKKSGKQFSIVLCDIDDFKKVNDTYGHECGDKVLINVSNTIYTLMRREDYVCRWGGEEILLLIHSNGDVACAIAERIRKTIMATYVMENDQQVHITMTFGIASYVPGYNMTKLIQIADDNLYVGKNNGKNQVVS